MSAMMIVEMNELFQFFFQVILVERNEEIQKLISTSFNPTFGVTVLPRRTDGGLFVFDTNPLQILGKTFSKKGIVIRKEITCFLSRLNLFTNRELQNLTHPFCSWICMNIKMKNLSRTDVKKENDTKDLFEVGRVNGKSIGNDHSIGMQQVELFPRKPFLRIGRSFGHIF